LPRVAVDVQLLAVLAAAGSCTFFPPFRFVPFCPGIYVDTEIQIEVVLVTLYRMYALWVCYVLIFGEVLWVLSVERFLGWVQCGQVVVASFFMDTEFFNRCHVNCIPLHCGKAMV
jgi:hypothetical protein